jgi:hypothetical protein
MSQKDDPEMDRIAEIARSGSGRSPLYRWLKSRHDAFLELVSEERPDWKRLAQGFQEIGVLSPDGNPLTPEAVRHTWWRVRRDVAAAREKKQAKAKPAVSVVTPAEPPPSAEPPVSDAGDKLSRLKGKINERSGR